MLYRNSLLLAIAIILTLVCADAAFAQGRGGGGGRPSGAGGGRPSTAGPPAGIGVDRGLGTARGRSNGRSDTGLGNASTRSGGRSDDGLGRARGRSTMPDNEELRRYTGISKKLGTTPEALRSQFDAALAANPDLTWGKFVSANVVANNLSRRFPAITSTAILAGLQSGDSLGETLQNLGLGEKQAEEVEKAAKREIKESKKNQ